MGPTWHSWRETASQISATRNRRLAARRVILICVVLPAICGAIEVGNSAVKPEAPGKGSWARRHLLQHDSDLLTHRHTHPGGRPGTDDDLHALGHAAERIAAYFREHAQHHESDERGSADASSSVAPTPKKCVAPPDIDYDVLQEQLTDQGADADPARNKLLVLDFVCVDQETIVLYDPIVLNDESPMPLPSIDLKHIQYFFRHASQAQAEHALESVQHLARPLVDEDHLSNLVAGDHLAYPDIQIRVASPEEVKALAEEDTPFSECTVPFVYASHWIHNFGEFFSRAVAWLYVYQKQRSILPRDITLAIYSPSKLPLAPFNIDLLRPFSAYAPLSFADLSSRLPSEFPSDSTYEGTHRRCFRKLMVWRDTGGYYPAMPPAGKHILQHYARRIETATRHFGSFWESSDPHTMRVLIETRPSKGARQFLELHALLEACRSWEGSFPAPSHNVQAHPGFRTVECKAFTFGSKGFIYDLVVMKDTDVLVSLHGAGEVNSNFMPYQSSIIEVRGNNATQLWMANIWNPLISHQSKFALFFWGLFVEDPLLVESSELDRAGLSDVPILNQNVHLKWEHLLPMLQQVAVTNKDTNEFRKRWGTMGDNVVWDVKPGHKELVPHGPLLT